MEEVNLFPTTIYVFHHNDNAIDTEVEGIPDDPDILSHISRNARADIKTGSHNGMKNLKMESNQLKKRRIYLKTIQK